MCFKGSAIKLKVGVNSLEGGGGVNTVKTQTFQKGGECMTPPPSLYGGADPV